MIRKPNVPGTYLLFLKSMLILAAVVSAAGMFRGSARMRFQPSLPFTGSFCDTGFCTQVILRIVISEMPVFYKTIH